MTWGNRPSLGQELRKIIEKTPHPVPSITKIMFRYMVNTKIRFYTWLKCSRQYDAPIWPLKVYQIPVTSIHYFSDINRNRYDTDVIDGDWDLSREEFAENIVYRSFLDLFEHNKNWEDTEYFEHYYDNMDIDYTNSELQNVVNHYQELYQSMNEYGLLPQKELEQTGNLIEEIHDAAFYPPSLREITVDIGRTGEILFGAGGQHRLSIAKILNLDSIPVRIRIRHKKWQQKRDHIWTNPDEYDLDDISHPDLLHVFQNRTSAN